VDVSAVFSSLGGSFNHTNYDGSMAKPRRERGSAFSGVASSRD
jgi:hypothetical protein